MSCKLFLLLSLVNVPADCLLSAVTYDFSGGRLGDCLLSYCHAKWISYRYQIPLLYKSFPYSDQLKMHELEAQHSDELAKQFKSVVRVSQGNVNIDRESGTLYIIPYFPESIFNREDREFPYLFTTNWDDPAFKSALQKMIAPRYALNSVSIPENVLTVAVHIRKGTGWDIPVYRITPKQLTASHPLRFAPDSFFISQLKRIASMFEGQLIYVYLFTDHNNPAELAQQYQKAVNCDSMIFNYRRSENNEFINVLDDFFALTHFDCMIRADSNFSYIASKLGNYKVIIAPWHGTVQAEETIIDEIALRVNNVSSIVRESF